MESRRAGRSGGLRASGLGGCVGFLGDAAEGLSGHDGGGGDGGAGDGAPGDFDDVGVGGVEVGLGHSDLVARQVVHDVR